MNLIADLTKLSNKKTIKISKRHEQTFPKRIYINDQEALGKILNIVNHQGNAD